MPIGASVAPNDRYMQWAGIWRKQVSLGEKWSIAGEKKLNHFASQVLAAHWSLYGETPLDRAGLRACPHCKSTAVDCTACPLNQVCKAKVCRRSAATGGAAAGAGALAPAASGGGAATLCAAGRRLPGEPSGKGKRYYRYDRNCKLTLSWEGRDAQ